MRKGDLCGGTTLGYAQKEIDALCEAVIKEEGSKETALTVSTHQTIRVDLNRGDQGEVYVWSREEATLIRDALNKELGLALRPQVYRDHLDGLGQPKVVYQDNVRIAQPV